MPSFTQEKSMRLPVSFAIAAALLASGALAAAAATRPPPVGAPPAALRATPVADAQTDRDSFTSKAEAEISDWQRKFDDVAHKAKAKGEEGSDAASRALDQAWVRTKEASAQLESAGAEGWDKAKARFQAASHDLAAEWHKVYPGEK
jgi:hypothetical protein